MLTALLFMEGVFSTLSELDFVVRVMVFSYMLFWLYMTFREAQLLFGIGTIVAGYLIFAHGITVTVVVVLWLVFFLLGSQLQMLCWFALFPLLGYQQAGGRLHKESEMAAQQNLQEIEQKARAGTASQEEIHALQEAYAQQEMQHEQAGRMRAG